MKKPEKLPSDRSFGFTFAALFLLAGAWLVWQGKPYGVAGVSLGVAFAAISLTIPRVLHPFNVVWMRFAALLNSVVSPVVLGVIFFCLFAPVGLYFRLTGRDSLRRAFSKEMKSYWIERTPPGPDGKSLPRQF